ncbi:DUF4190 domain-containing protein [Streptomyces sp. NPDC046870]|uniref:DUF4190 domain-containing protein n=1 Tax=Streptomyces sp. NPDC046870 TaxID=3155135 RepID=UPI003456FEA9
MSDEVPQSTPGERIDGHHSAAPRVSFDKGPERTAPVPREADGARVQDAAPAPGPAHDRQTVTSLPAFPAPATPAGAVPAPWAAPAEGPASTAPAPQPNPFAPPPGSYPPPANPFAPPAPPAGPHGGAEPVPPPPIAPDGPGQVPYGYPGAAPAYGYPGAGPAYGYPGPRHAPYGGPAPYPAAHGYAWPGMQPPPSNGLGTASLVLGIVATVGFVLWPIALAMGILAVILGGLGRGRANRGEATNPGVALAGVICGAAGIVLVLVLFALLIATRT